MTPSTSDVGWVETQPFCRRERRVAPSFISGGPRAIGGRRCSGGRRAKHARSSWVPTQPTPLAHMIIWQKSKEIGRRNQVIREAFLALLLAITLNACTSQSRGSSSWSVKDSRSRGLLVTEYILPPDANLGDYRVIEVWIESTTGSSDRQIVVRLQGPHVGQEPRVRVVGREALHYRSIWSRRDGPPYETWTAPDPLPEVLMLERDGKRIELRMRST